MLRTILPLKAGGSLPGAWQGMRECPPKNPSLVVSFKGPKPGFIPCLIPYCLAMVAGRRRSSLQQPSRRV